MANSMDEAAQAATPRFNLVDEPWIPVRWLDGRHGELGIRDTLLQAERIAEIQDASPLVVAALHRFLLAVLYRALEGPADGQQAKTWFKQGWAGGKIEAYLEKWRERFWLFDPRYPFAAQRQLPWPVDVNYPGRWKRGMRGSAF
ncbi:type I-E CRISPR-associated protein Cse1/CasA, partial [Thauera aminoaromatica]